MENQERELLKKCADFLQRDDASEIISFILNNNISYTEIKEAYNKVYISPLTPFQYIELNRENLYFEFDYKEQQNNHYEVDLDFDDLEGRGTIKIRK